MLTVWIAMSTEVSFPRGGVEYVPKKIVFDEDGLPDILATKNSNKNAPKKVAPQNIPLQWNGPDTTERTHESRLTSLARSLTTTSMNVIDSVGHSHSDTDWVTQHSQSHSISESVTSPVGESYCPSLTDYYYYYYY